MLSSVSFSACTPVGINYPHDASFEISQNLYAFADGFNMYVAPVLQNARDVSLNRGEVVILTDYLSLEDCIEQNKKTDTSVQFATTVNVSGVGYWSCDSSVITITPDKINDSNIFIFKFDTATETVQVLFESINFLTYDDTTSTLSFQPESLVKFNGISPQIFNYILDGNQIVLFTNFAFLSSQQTITWNTLSNVLSTTSTISVVGDLPPNTVFGINERPDVANVDSYQYGQSNWVQYNGDYESLSIKRSLSGIPQNVLITTPYKTLSGDQLVVNVNGLKNHLTPDCELNISPDDTVKQRDYYAIFTGNNQEMGYENIFLGYEGGTQGITFKKDKMTWFHYPNQASQININDTTLAVNGAIASNTPYKSDKVFKKKADYKKYSTWGESLPVYEQNGTWLCTWLSGSPDPDTIPMWVDRYINPFITGSVSAVDDLIDLVLTSDTGTFITTTDLSGLEISGDVFVAKLFKSYQQTYIDTPSLLTFDPGVLYTYHHLGENDNQSIVGHLSGGSKSYFVSSGLIESASAVGTEQIMYIGDWTSTVATDKSNFSNNINVVNTPGIVSIGDLVYNTFSTKTSAYGISQYPVNFDSYEGFTLVVNISANDWGSLYGDQIIGNSFDGGTGIFVNNRALTPLFYVYETTQGRNLELNSDLYILQESKLSNIAATSAVEYLFKKDLDEGYFIVDSGKNVLRYDSSNILLSANSVSATITGNVLDVQMDMTGDLYIASTTGVYHYDINNGILTYEFDMGSSTKIAIDLRNQVTILPPGTIDYTYDSNNDLFYITSTGLYKNGQLALSGVDVKKVNCDIYDNIWVLHDNKISKLTNHPYRVSSTTLSSAGNSSMTICRNLIGRGVVEEYIVVIDETNSRITKLGMDNSITSTSSVSSLSGQFTMTGSMMFRLPKGDPSGYEYQRKYARNLQTTGGIHVSVYTNHKVTLRPKVFKLYADVKNLTSGFHNFLVSFDTIRGNVKLYIDGENVAQTSSDINSYQFTYKATNYRNEPRLMVGVSSAKNGTIPDKIKQPYSYIFDGGFNEIRIYDRALIDDNIRYAARNGYTNIYNDMVWNMPVGDNQYLEEVERFFQHRLPGNKSQFFNLRIRGYTPTDTDTKTLFEDSIRRVITKIVPAYTQLKDINWIT